MRIWAIAKLLIKEIFRKKDFYVALILMGVILAYASKLSFYNAANIHRYLLEIGLFLIFLFSNILIVALAARQYPSEKQNRTCAVLLAKPLSRWEFVCGKFLGSFAAGLAAFVIFYGLFLLLALPKAGGLPLAIVLQLAYLFALSLLVLAAMTSGLSYYLTPSANISISLVLYLAMLTYGATLRKASEHLNTASRFIGDAFYFALPHFEFFDLRQRFIHGWEPISPQLLGFVTAYAFAYTAIFLLAGWMKFERARL